jgi:hypothetical protein
LEWKVELRSEESNKIENRGEEDIVKKECGCQELNPDLLRENFTH